MRAIVVAVAVLLLPASALAAEPTYETLTVPTVGDAQVHVEIARPAGGEKVPVILTYSPYNTLSEYNPEPDGRRPRQGLRPQGLRARRGRRARHAQLDRLLGLRR